MENLFNKLTKHQESLNVYSSLITNMYHTVSQEKERLKETELTPDDLSKIWGCCNDLKLIFENAHEFSDYKSFSQRYSKNLLSGNSAYDCLMALKKLRILYFEKLYEKDSSLYQRLQQIELCKEIEKTLLEAIEN